MAPPRPDSANSTAETSTSFFTDRSSVLSLIDSRGSKARTDRPISAILSHAVDAAHYKHDNQSVLHPQTYAYSTFTWRVGQALTSASPAEGTPGFGSRPASPSIPRSHAGSSVASASIRGPLSGRPSSAAGRSSTSSRPASGYSERRQRSDAGVALVREPVDLEVQSLYDSNFQAANPRGQHGTPLRGLGPPRIGPISYLYRFYCKRSTQFVGSPTAADVPDAPAMPPPDEPAGSSRARRTSTATLTTHTTAAPHAPSALNASWAAPRGAAGASATTRSSPASSATPGAGKAAAGSAPSAATAAAAGSCGRGEGKAHQEATTSGRWLNRSLDPVMSLGELVVLLEDMEVVPHLASRTDIAKLFHAARQAALAPQQQPHSHSQPHHLSPHGKAPARAPSGPAVIASAQVRPEELRFPAFKDFLVRLAVAIGCSAHPPTPASQPAGAAAATPEWWRAPGGGMASAPPPPAPSLEALASGWARSVGSEEAAGAVLALLGRLGVTRSHLPGLKERLDVLARTSREHGPRVNANKLLYVGGPSALAAAAGTPYGAPPPWGVLSPAAAPPYLAALVAGEDRGEEGCYRPAWREFGGAALDLGVLELGELRQCRILLLNRGSHQLSVRVDAGGAPFASCSHVGLHALSPGTPKHVDVAVRLTEVGEAVGELRLVYCSSRDPRERVVVVPVYGMVGVPSGVSYGGVRRAPTTASERSSFAAKYPGEQRLPAKVAAAAVAAGPLPHRAPPRRALSAVGDAAAATATSLGSTGGAASRLGSTGGGGGGSLLSTTSGSVQWLHPPPAAVGSAEWYGELYASGSVQYGSGPLPYEAAPDVTQPREPSLALAAAVVESPAAPLAPQPSAPSLLQWDNSGAAAATTLAPPARRESANGGGAAPAAAPAVRSRPGSASSEGGGGTAAGGGGTGAGGCFGPQAAMSPPPAPLESPRTSHRTESYPAIAPAASAATPVAPPAAGGAARAASAPLACASAAALAAAAAEEREGVAPVGPSAGGAAEGLLPFQFSLPRSQASGEFRQLLARPEVSWADAEDTAGERGKRGKSFGRRVSFQEGTKTFGRRVSFHEGS